MHSPRAIDKSEPSRVEDLIILRMDRDTLFLRTLNDLRDRVRSRDEYEVLMSAAYLRKLLIDDQPLVHQVNRQMRLPIRFEVTRFLRPAWAALWARCESMHPAFASPGTATRTLTHKNQQFKDSAIWEAALDLAANGRVDIISEDKGFFEGRDPGKGMATSLHAECQGHGRDIRLFHDLTSYLESLKEETPSYPEERVIEAIAVNLREDLIDWGADKNFSIGDLRESSLQAFVTEKSATLAISWEMSFEVFDLDWMPMSESATW